MYVEPVFCEWLYKPSLNCHQIDIGWCYWTFQGGRRQDDGLKEMKKETKAYWTLQASVGAYKMLSSTLIWCRVICCIELLISNQIMAGGVDDLQNDHSKYISTKNSLPAVQRNVKK